MPAVSRARPGSAAREWALHFPSGKDPGILREILARDRESRGKGPGAALASPAARAALERALPRILREKRRPFGRIYYGAEFCERLIPRPEEFLEVLEIARSAGNLAVSVLTPRVTDAGLDRLGPLLEAAARAGEETEVVANDWGVLRMARREFPGLAPVLGRLLNKMMREPRLAPFYSGGPAEARKALSGSSVSLPGFRRFLRRLGVRRIELDPLYQGIGLDLRRSGLRGTVYLPFGYVSSGRICLAASLRRRRRDKPRFDLPCGRECREHDVVLRNIRSPHPETRSLLLYQRGNTVFYAIEGTFLERTLSSLGRIGADRVVLELDLPME